MPDALKVIDKLSELEGDVLIASPGDKELLSYEAASSKWKNGAYAHNDLDSIQGGGAGERYHFTLTQHTAAIRDATNALNGLMPADKLDNWDAAYSHISSTGSSHGWMNQDVRNTATVAFAGILTPKLKGGAADIEVFEEDSIANGMDGWAIIVHRKALEGDSYVKIYTDSWEQPKIYLYTESTSAPGVIQSSGSLFVYPASGKSLVLGGSGTNRTVSIGTSTGTAATPLRHFGNLAGIGQKYVQLKVDDNDGDQYVLSREDANITGFKIDMPIVVTGAADVQNEMRCNTLRIDQTPGVGTITPDKLLTVSCNGVDFEIGVKQKP